MAQTRGSIACIAYQAIDDAIGLVPYKEKMEIIEEVIEILSTMHDRDMAIDCRKGNTYENGVIDA